MYWFENIRKPVRYVQTVTRMLEDGYDFLAEVGPHPVLVSGTRGIAQTAKRPINVLPAMTRGSDIDPVLRLLGASHALGGSVDLSPLHSGGRLVDLPLYPFQRESHWFEKPQVQQDRVAKSKHPFLKSSTSLTDDGRGIIQLQLSTGVSPFLADHVVDGAVVFPMTGHIEAAFLTAKVHMPLHKKVWLEDVRFEHPMVLASPEDFAPQALVEIVSPAKDYVISTRPASSTSTDSWQVFSRGRINAFDDPPSPDLEALDSITTRLQKGTEVDVEGFYRKLDVSGLRYGDSFRCIQRLYRLGSEVFSLAKLPPLFASEAGHFKFHPALLDACLHTLSAYIHHHGNPLQVYLPYHAEKIDILATGGVTAGFAHIQVNRHDDVCIVCDAAVYGLDGQILAIIRGLTVKRLQGEHQTRHTDYRVSYHHDSEQNVTKVPAEFDHALIIEPQNVTSDWVKSTVQTTFPSARVYQTGWESTATSWETAKWGFQLDRRALVIIPALVSGPSHWDFHERLHAVIQTLVRVASWINEQQEGATLLVLTNGSCMTASDLQCHPVSSSIQAAALVMANELPKSRPRIIDLPVDQPQDHEISLLQDELRTARLNRHESVVAIRPAGRFFRRIEPVDLEEEERKNQRVLSARGGKYHADASSRGTFNDIVLRQQHPRTLGPNEVGIEVHATGLNFKDVINAMGLLSERATSGGMAGQTLGLEIAGRIVEVGDEVHDMKIGDPVMAQAPSGFGGFAVVRRSLCVPMPSTVSFPQAASVPAAFVTAYYCLVYLGRLTAGESILIHSAAGGVGVAAIQIAKLLGARAYGTAGSPSRRARVSEMGADAVFDSRSLSIHDEIKKVTDGHGVDVVLNSLTGSMLSQSFACLAPFGRFLEMGKTDIYRNMRLGLEQFGQNRSLFVIDIDRLAGQKPLLHRQMMVEIYGLFESGKLVPPEIKTHSITDLSKALSELSRSTIVGKAVIENPQGHSVQASPPSRLQLRSDRSYLITGGTTGLGLHIARLLVERGARHLVLISRSGPKTPEDYAIISGLEGRGVVVDIERGDTSDPEVATSLFREQAKWPPIAGVVHSAGVLDDAYSYNTTTDSFWKVFAPKALGALNLHRATQDFDLDFFVLVSSISSVLGLNGQLSYAAANQFLDGLAHHRRASGLPGVSLNLGVLEEYAGMSGNSAHNDRVLQVLESQGFAPMNLSAVFSTIERAILHGSTQRMAAIIDWSMFLKAHPHLILSGTFQGLDRDQAGGNGTDSNQTLAQLSGPERVDAISNTLRSGVAKIVGVHVDRISDSENINQYAFDSLTLTQIRSLILREFRVPYPMMKLFEGPSLKEIASEVDGSTDNAGDKGSNLESNGNSSSAPISSHGLTILSSWFVRGAPAKRPSPRLVCFHSMGASASLFAPFLLNPPDGLDVVAVQLPGRDTRADEPVEENLGKIVSGILSEIDQVVGAPHIFWGHSFGGIIALEVLRALRRQGKPLPRLVISGTIAPHLVEKWQRRDVLLQLLQEDYSPEYMMAVSRYVDDADFVRSILPMMRQDAPLLLNYQFYEEEPLDLPITAFAARQDDLVYPDEVAAWQKHSKEFRLIEVNGDHWFLYRNRELIRETLTGMIE